jgi:hypothetical protein
VSLLLIGLPETFAAKLVQRLREEGDEVRLLLREGSGAEPWKKLGAFVATGEAGDADLIERAATNVRTIVLGEETASLSMEELGELLAGARKADVGRVVVCQAQPDPGLVEVLRSSGVEFVVLTTAKKPLVGKARTRIPISKLSEAVDAADDIAGRIQAELDLTIPKAWKVLKVSPPVER